MSKKQQLIGLSEETYTRLGLFKRGSSFNEIVTIMLNYFEVTKIDPRTCQESPTISFLKELDRIIKIVKGQEKSYNAKFDDILNKVGYLESIFRNVDDLNNTSLSLEDLEKEGLTRGDLLSLTTQLGDNPLKEQLAIEENQQNKRRLESVLTSFEKLKVEAKIQQGAYCWSFDWLALSEALKNKVEHELNLSEIALADCTLIDGRKLKEIPIHKKEDFFYITKMHFDKIYQNLTEYYHNNVR